MYTTKNKPVLRLDSPEEARENMSQEVGGKHQAIKMVNQ